MAVVMRSIQLVYEVLSASGIWNRYALTTDNMKEYERAVNIIHQNPDEYRVVDVKYVNRKENT